VPGERDLPIRTINVGFPLCIATTGLAAKISLACGREHEGPEERKKRNVRAFKL
jgi:hypothetical protein